jgi:hypothetical protein
MQRLNIYNKCFIVFFMALIVFIILKVPHEKEKESKGKGSHEQTAHNNNPFE